MTTDPETLAVYDARAQDYAARFAKDHTADPALKAFAEAIPAGSLVLDFGCGPGSWARALIALGLRVEALDASASMVAEAAKIPGLTVHQATFDEFEASERYEGVWANFSLLHAAREDMPRHLAALHKALKPGGLLHIGLKTGEGEERDGIGRLYTFFTVEEVTGLLATLDMETFDLREGRSMGLAEEPADWFTLTARKV